jgi:chemotaxis receptor (MCP) glutamine deamidase CheD
MISIQTRIWTSRKNNRLVNEGTRILVAHVGESDHRRLVFDISTGDVWARFTPSNGAVGNTRPLNGRK